MTSEIPTISDIIIALEAIRYDQGDLPVLVDGYEEGFDAAQRPRVEEVFDRGEAKKKSSWWNGRYDEAIYEDGQPTFGAVVIGR